MQKYPFQINTNILNLTAEISELVGSMSTLTEAARSPQLRRSNRIKTIYSSLAIEQNTLSLEQVTAVLSGKRVLAPPKDIAEVQNAFNAVDRLCNLDSSQAFFFFSVRHWNTPFYNYSTQIKRISQANLRIAFISHFWKRIREIKYQIPFLSSYRLYGKITPQIETQTFLNKTGNSVKLWIRKHEKL